ncbi:hypothetical protein BD324DRAFT_224985 [Kockovaella imperatae]|uniref:Uncharacterized protein n=1 Tax=Kockovaella imperatae TaxID=4999 RepID=A0A1Y1UR80_9TREE|nr:hypothetical protein BD324DRAFT_224985 [Kockovaella imperatae]ORX39655.1 hypothetical protein BD324DRAFT_224985 [Kockovaella imperatae]
MADEDRRMTPVTLRRPRNIKVPPRHHVAAEHRTSSLWQLAASSRLVFAMHFEAYIKKLTIIHTATPGKDTVHQLLAFRQNDVLLSPEKNPAYSHRGSHKGGKELTEVKAVKGANLQTATQQELDRQAAILIESLGKAIGHGIDHFTREAVRRLQNHDCILIYDTITIKNPEAWEINKPIEFKTLRGFPQASIGHPEYALDLVVVRHT